ncbi:hypothetical protein [Rhizobium sp. BK176]|uniref:hypothetical protein n=1 Tax=Rhizobium sp. BK176 TaxID=2587071 RepID=UPI0021676B44|nr:hypothetical protein [Rhizobium sp. BK176]MCS4089278.1 GNAT superfamily N-acetyltransferase [Rhizobium sp. BK176]
MAEKYNPILAEVARQPVVPRGTVDEIFPMGDRTDQRDYIFNQVEGQTELDRLIEALKGDGGDEHWEYDKWLRSAAKHEKIVVEVKQEGDDKPAGFAIFGMTLAFEDHGDDEVESHLYLTLDLAAIYLSPCHRGRGFSAALSWAVGYQVETVIEALKELAEEKQPSAPEGGLEIFISGEAQSAGGARYLATTVERIKSNLEFLSFEAGWAGDIDVIDDIDFSDFPDCGFSEEDQILQKPTYG